MPTIEEKSRKKSSSACRVASSIQRAPATFGASTASI